MKDQKAKVIFTLDGINSTLECCIEDKMGDICKKFATKEDKMINSLLFIYEDKQVNFELSFEDQASPLDRQNSELKISVYKKENKELISNILLKEEINEIIFSIGQIKDDINTIKLKLENMIKKSLDDSTTKHLEKCNTTFCKIDEVIEITNQNIKNLLDDNNAILKERLKESFCKKINNNNEKETNISKLINMIHSDIIMKLIFSNLEERLKLKFIQFNKYIQKK